MWEINLKFHETSCMETNLNLLNRGINRMMWIDKWYRKKIKGCTTINYNENEDIKKELK